MADLLSQEEYHYQQPQRGEIRTGTVVSVGPNEIVVDIGVKREGLVSPRDLERLSAEERADISVGDQLPVYVVKPEDPDGNLIVSLYLAQIGQDWQRAEEYLKSNELFQGKVSGYNKGGLVVPFGKIRGFVPASQVADFPRQLSQDERISRLIRQVGRDIVVRIIEVDRKRKRLIMSEQIAQREWREQQRRKLMDSLTEGQVVHGVVTSLADFGAFVDLGGTDGLIHISELSWQRIKHPREVVKVGDEVDVYVLKLDRTNGRIGLSLRRLQPDPWTLVDTKYSVGQRVEGTITNVVDFGVFAQLEDGIEGLIHLSELSDTAISHPSDVVKCGNRYLLEIVKIEPQRQRIGLSLKRVPPDEQSAWRAQITGVESSPTPAATTEPTAQVEATSPVEAGRPQLTDLPTEAATGEPSLEAIVEKPVA
jgi:small subunit ribosomal protein S1